MSAICWRQGALTAQALYDVFILPAYQTSTTANTIRQRYLPRSRELPRATLSGQRRAFAGSAGRWSKTREPEKRTQKWNEEIDSRFVMLVDPETNALPRDPETNEIIGRPQTRWDVLNRLDLKTHRLVQLTPDEPNNPNFIPVCKIISKKEMFDAEKRQRENSRKQKAVAAKVNSVKTFELNWAIDGNDLAHRLEKMQEFLSEGRRVEIILAAKKKGRKADKADCEGVLQKIYEKVDAVPGAKRLKELDGKLGGFATLVLQGRPPNEQPVKS